MITMSDSNTIHTGDCLRHLAGLPAGCVDLAFADPPFNIGYEYDVYDDRQSRELIGGQLDAVQAGMVLLRRDHGADRVPDSAQRIEQRRTGRRASIHGAVFFISHHS